MERKRHEWDDIIEKHLKENLWKYEQLREHSTEELYDAFGMIGQA